MTDVPDGDPDIYYIPGAWNQYDYNEHIIILDERLKDYPTAHDVILEHEKGHADARTVRELAIHEWKSDVRQYFSTDPEIEAVREYYRETDHAYDIPALRLLGYGLFKSIRGVSRLALQSLGYLYRGVA